jgi:hypothetical protein
MGEQHRSRWLITSLKSGDSNRVHSLSCKKDNGCLFCKRERDRYLVYTTIATKYLSRDQDLQHLDRILTDLREVWGEAEIRKRLYVCGKPPGIINLQVVTDRY